MHNFKLVLFTLVMVGSLCALGQTGSTSPYSSSGLGELKPSTFLQHQATGGTSISQQERGVFSAANPASYANIDFTIFDAGLRASVGTRASATATTPIASGNFNHFAMAFPLGTKRKMGVSFGTNQYSDIGYNARSNTNTDTPSYYNIFSGSGGISRVYVGYGLAVLKNLKLGANVNYNFGSILAAKARIHPNTNNVLSFSDEKSVAYRGLDYTLGVQYSLQQNRRGNSKSKEPIKHTFGAALQTRTQLKGEGYRYAETFYGSLFEQGVRAENLTIDTLIYEGNKRDTLTKPLGFTLGYTVSKGDQWALSLETEQNQWSSIQNGSKGNSFFNNTRYSAGLSIVPSTKYSEKGDFFGKIKYSAGFRYENLYYNFQNTQLSEVGISFGVGLPVIRSFRLDEEKVAVVSRINITAEYVQRGTTANGLLQEDFFNIGIGLNFNDKWFTKRKYQ